MKSSVIHKILKHYFFYKHKMKCIRNNKKNTDAIIVARGVHVIPWAMDSLPAEFTHLGTVQLTLSSYTSLQASFHRENTS